MAEKDLTNNSAAKLLTDFKTVDMDDDRIQNENTASLQFSMEEPLTPGGSSLPTWKDWDWRRTISYWITIFYLEGCFLFVVGACFDLSSLPKLSRDLSTGLVSGQYFVGQICFLVGGYCGILQITNSNRGKNKRFVWCAGFTQWKRTMQHVGTSGVLGYLFYFVGSSFGMFSQISSIGGSFLGRPSLAGSVADWIASVIGSGCFAVGGTIHIVRNRTSDGEKGCNTLSFWICLVYFLGGFLFLLAAIAGLAGAADASLKTDAQHTIVALSYLVGSLLYLVGALISLYMWKNEQFGLVLFSEINKGGAQHLDAGQLAPESVLKMHEEYGCGKSSTSQLVWLLLYVLNASVSVLQLSVLLAHLTPQHKCQVNKQVVSTAGSAAIGLLLNHGILVLGSIIHHVPTVNPHRWLLWFMRVILLAYFINALLQVDVLIDSVTQVVTDGRNNTDCVFNL